MQLVTNSESIIPIKKRLYQAGVFDFITVLEGKKHHKQELALKLLTDNETTELGYGGAAGGAKSWTGCVWLAFMCLCYPETRWFIGREELKRLRESTLLTFYKVCRKYFIKGWKYNGQDHFIQFENGSRIDLLDLKFLPSDPLFERYGSTEYTGGWIEEGGETVFAAYDTLKSRIGRQLNDKYGLTRKLFCTFNPKKNYVDTYFYRPYSKGELPEGRRFIPALITDNPHVEKDYIDVLKSITNEVARQRLLHGNFDYDDDPSLLCDYDAICDVFTNDHVLPTNDKAISADLAMQGRDSFIAGVWAGMVCTVKIDKPKAKGKEIEEDIKRLMLSEGIGRSQVIVDSDGLGAYLESYLTGIKEFHAGAKAIDSTTFANLKTECAYKLAELINKREIKVICSTVQREKIVEELGQLKEADIDADEKRKRIISKDKMKESLQRSPDYLDMLLMRMYFVVQPKLSWVTL